MLWEGASKHGEVLLQGVVDRSHSHVIIGDAELATKAVLGALRCRHEWLGSQACTPTHCAHVEDVPLPWASWCRMLTERRWWSAEQGVHPAQPDLLGVLLLYSRGFGGDWLLGVSDIRRGRVVDGRYRRCIDDGRRGRALVGRRRGAPSTEHHAVQHRRHVRHRRCRLQGRLLYEFGAQSVEDA
jgi:hypothetical protein